MDEALFDIAPEDERISILAVDDRPDKLLALEAMLGDMPVNIVRAASGREALRWLLRQEFALVLLDIDMPLMDGFETAQLIRQRKASEHLPIIFVTAHQDEMFVSRGYSLGAVDYILQPVMPNILRSKVAVFVDLFRKTRMVERQARWQLQRASQLQKLAHAAIAINAAPDLPGMLHLITECAREIIGSQQAMTLHRTEAAGETGGNSSVTSFSDKYLEWRGRTPQLEGLAKAFLGHLPNPTRLTNAQLHAQGDWEALRRLDLPPIYGVLAAPLLRRDGRNMGIIYLSDKCEGAFNADDEAILVQLSRMGAVAIENLVSAEAREANRAKDQFIAVLSHELRTPLTPVLAMLDAITKDHALSDGLRADLDVIWRNVRLEARLIDDLLDLTRISKGKVELHPRPVDVHEVLREAIAICEPEINEKRISLKVSLGAESSHAMADPTRLQQVFWNLIKNAAKFTPDDGRVTVTTTDSTHGLRLEVSDNGIGIAADVLPRIFKAFEQGSSAVTHRFGGLGLGLAISKRLIEMHQGRLEAQSAGTQSGATFIVTLPVCAPPAAPNPAAAAPQQKHSAPGTGAVLLVEDHRDTGVVMRRLLRQAGYEVDLARSVTEALALAVQKTYRVLISDIGLPDGTGLDLMRKLQARAPILGIALSGFGMDHDIRKSRDAGFADHVTKPVDISVLLQKLERLTMANPAEAELRGVEPQQLLA